MAAAFGRSVCWLRKPLGRLLIEGRRYAKVTSAAHSARALLRVPLLGLQRARGKAVWAGVAQLVEHLICNQRVGGSNPFVSSSSIQHGKDLVVLPDRSGHADLRSLLQGKKTRSIRGSD